MGISFWQIILLLLVVILVFGSKRLGSLGSDIGKALKGFKKEVKDDNDTDRNTWISSFNCGNILFYQTREDNLLFEIFPKNFFELKNKAWNS